MELRIKLTDSELNFFKTALEHPQSKENAAKYELKKGAWIKMSESQLKDWMADCICTSGQLIDTKYDEFTKNEVFGKGLWMKNKREITKALRRGGIRWPTRKAEQIWQNRDIEFKELMSEISRYYGGTVEDERKARRILVDKVHGFGQKQASNFLKNIGFSNYIIPIDSRWLNFLTKYCLTNIKPNELNYCLIEDFINQMANYLQVGPITLDESIWTFEGLRKRHKK